MKNKLSLIIDSREQGRIPIAEKYFKDNGYEVKVQELPVGDYLINNKIVFEFKVWSDFMSSITDGRLWNESLNQIENFDIHFIVIHGTNRDYNNAFDHNGLEDKHITGAIARLLTFTKIIRGTGTLTDTFELMRITAEKCQDDKALIRQFDTKTPNYAFNVLAYCVDDIKGERAKNIVNSLNLKTITDVTNLTYDDLLTVPGIGDKLAKKILEAIK